LISATNPDPISNNKVKITLAGAIILLFRQSDGVSLTRMPAQADIIVSSPDSTEVKLVVEAKLQSFELQKTERQFKNFMLQLRCPLGLLVSPQRLRVYQDRFTSDSENSIELVGDFDITGLIRFQPPSTGAGVAFEKAVQSWLEDDLSRSTSQNQVKDPKLLEIINHYILPAVETGVVRATGPR
jgi:hypothetical protein